jgi:hypothetical protein
MRALEKLKAQQQRNKLPVTLLFEIPLKYLQPPSPANPRDQIFNIDIPFTSDEDKPLKRRLHMEDDSVSSTPISPGNAQICYH